MTDFSGKNILIVGGSSGIGLALARRLIAADATVTTLGSFSRLRVEQFLSDFELNLLGAVRVLQFCLRSFLPSGASVVMFSTVAVRTGLSFHASIAAAKGVVESLVRSLAASAEFLLSDDSTWITGQVLSVDGGYSSLRMF